MTQKPCFINFSIYVKSNLSDRYFTASLFVTIQSNEKGNTNFVCSSVLLKNATAFFNKTYRELYNYKLLDTCLWQTGNF